MLRRTLLALLLAGLSTPAAWGAEPPTYKVPTEAQRPAGYKNYYGGYRFPYSEYKTWPEAEQLRHVGWVLEGFWAVFQFTGRYWHGIQLDTYQGCKVEPRAVWESIHRSPRDAPAQMIGERSLYVYKTLCDQEGSRSGRGVAVTLQAEYNAWPEPRQIRYVDVVMTGIEDAYNLSSWNWPKKLRAPFEYCKVDQPAVSAALAKTAGPQDGKRSAAKLIFTAYETACREHKTLARLGRDGFPADAAGAAPRPQPAPRTTAEVYEAWPAGERVAYVTGVMEGIWTAFQMTSASRRDAPSDTSEALQGCRVHPRHVAAFTTRELKDSMAPRGVAPHVHTAYIFECRRFHDLKQRAANQPLGKDTVADYRTWPVLRRRLFVDHAVEGIHVTFQIDGTSWARSVQAALSGCKLLPGVVQAELERRISSAAAETPLAKQVFTAFVSACHQAVGY